MRSHCVLLCIGCCLLFTSSFSKTPIDRLRPDHSMQKRHPSEPPKLASNGFRIIEQQVDRWDVDLAAFVNSFCVYYYYYSESGLLWGEFSQTWDGSNFSNGENDYHTLHFYDQKGVLTETTQQIFTSNDWVNNFRHTFPVYRDGLNFQEIWEQWENGAWKPTMRTTMSVDSAAKQISRLDESWDGAQWDHQWLFLEPLLAPDVIVPLITRERKSWDETLNAWVNYEQELSMYLSDSTDMYLVQSWQNGTYVNAFRFLSEYEGNNTVYSEFQNWVNDAWLPSNRYFYEIDERGFNVLTDYQTYEENQWVSNQRTLFHYDAYGNEILAEVFNWLAYPGEWGKDSRISKRYESFTKVNKNHLAAPVAYRLENYPNPFNAVTVVEVAIPLAGQLELALYNTLGQQCRVLFTGRLSAGTHRFELDAANLPSGCYLLRLDHETGQLMRRMQLVK